MDTSWDVFDYERSMVVALSRRMTSAALAQLDWDVRNAVVESAVLHTRILCDVLLSRGTEADEITLKKLLSELGAVSLVRVR